MKTVKEIINHLTESLNGKYLSAIDMGEIQASNLPIDEIIGLAAKLKKEDLAKSGMADQIALDAEKYYLEQLRARYPKLYEEYFEAKSSKLNKEQKRKLFLKLEEIFPDTEIKLKYIESKMRFDIHSDREYIIRACRTIASHHIAEEIENLKILFDQHSGNATHFNNYLNIIDFLDEITLSALFRKQMLKTLASAFAGKRVRIIFYKCLRLTHDGGEVGFHHLLDDHFGFDKDGKRLKFIVEADIFQLNAIKKVIEKFRELNLTSENILIISDFDLLKFKGYNVPQDKINAYLNCLKEYFSKANITIQLETEYFKVRSFNSKFAEIWESIDKGYGKYINHDEFLRIERDYKDHFSKTMKKWDDDRNRYYSVSSVARNIAEGIYLSSKSTIMFVFGESVVHGDRFNLATKIKTPFLGLEKMKAKVQEDGIMPV